nr:6K1 protein [Sorghum mosaic virus]
AKSNFETNLEQAMAVGTLLTMVLDPIKSDAVFKVLNKIKTCINTYEQSATFPTVNFSSLLGTQVTHQ